MSTIFFRPMRMSTTDASLGSPDEDLAVESRRKSFVDPPLLTPSRSSSLRGFSRRRSLSSAALPPKMPVEDAEVKEFEIDIDTPVSMCMRWQDILDSVDESTPTSSSSSETLTDDMEVVEFRHTFAQANSMKLRVNPNNGLLGFRKTAARRGTYVPEGSIGQTLVDSAFVLPPKKPDVPKASRLASPDNTTLTGDKKSPSKLAAKLIDLRKKTDVPEEQPSTVSKEQELPAKELTSITKEQPSVVTEPPAVAKEQPPVAKTAKPTTLILKAHIESPKPVSPPVEKLPDPTPAASEAEVDIDEDDSIFSSLRNVDLVSSHAPESARTRETKKQEVNKNVMAFLGGYKQQPNRIKMTGDMLNRAKNIRKRTAEGQLGRKLQDARMRIPQEFQNMSGILPRKTHAKRIRFPDDKSELEHIYIFEVESDVEDDDDNRQPTPSSSQESHPNDVHL
ncbi:hypothetical protein AC1031_004679 [Aphanomyces cochlioides]|nr:hypothetical protein AC1031_004679 [Aphanomyces cochlioides]